MLLTIAMHIGPTMFLKFGPPNAKYNSENRLHEECNSADWRDDGEIEETIAVDNDKDEDEKDP